MCGGKVVEHQDIQLIKGHIVHTPNSQDFEVYENSILVVKQGKVAAIVNEQSQEYVGGSVQDYGDRLIIPGFVDLHLHGAQFLQCGMGMTRKLLEWLNDYTFSLEQKFQDRGFARDAYTLFAEKLVAAGTLRSCIFASSSTSGTEELFEALKRAGVGGYVGKVAMDCNAPASIIEPCAETIAGDRYLIEKYKDEPLVKPIITPRFVPTCSGQLMKELGRLALEFHLPVQSHLNESPEEIAWVKELFPEAQSYSHLYDQYDLFGTVPTIMAHCVHMGNDDLELVKKRGVFMVHCPDSNINVRSGIMPVREFFDQGFNLGLASDIAGSHKLAMNEAMVRAIQLSKLRSLETGEKPLTASEVFYLGTKGGGRFFGNTGSFEKGYSFDALVLEDEPMIAEHYSITDRLEKFLYTGDDRNICARYVEGRKL